MNTLPQVRVVTTVWSGYPARDKSWLDHGACTAYEPEAFYPGRGESPTAARNACARCKVRPACAQWAFISRQRFGVWGGMTQATLENLNTARIHATTASRTLAAQLAARTRQEAA